MLQSRKEGPVGFFDGLKRDTKQARTVEEVDQPQTQEQEVVAAEAVSYTHLDVYKRQG